MLRQHLLLVALLASACAGCRSLVAVRESQPEAEEVAISELLVEDFARKLDGDLWQLNSNWSPRAEFQSQIEGVPALARLRWSHPGAAEVLRALQEEEDASPGQSRELAALAARDDLSGWNAAIVWAEIDPIAARPIVPVLRRLIEKPPTYSYDPNIKSREQQLKKNPNDPGALIRKNQVISPLMQSAAVEAWCLMQALSPEDKAAPMAPAIEALTNATLAETVQCDLMLGIAREIPPKEIPRVVEALRATVNHKKIERASTESRRAAVEACIVHAIHNKDKLAKPEPDEETTETSADDPWPEAIWNLQWDEDPAVRGTFGEFMAILGHPQAFEILNSHVQDKEVQVRMKALASLGILRTPAAREILQRQMQRKEELLRTAAIRGLAVWGPSELAPFAKDRTFNVRQEVALQLGQFHNAEAADILRTLVGDSNLEVQLSALEAIEPWPNELAIPLLLQALRDGSFKARQLGLVQLEQRRGETLQFPLLAGREERVALVTSMKDRWSVPSESAIRLRPGAETHAPQGDAGRVLDIKEHLAIFAEHSSTSPEVSSDLDWLRQLTPADVPLIEQLLPSVSLPQAEVLLGEVLAKQSPLYGAVLRLESPEVMVRRQGAQTIAEHAAKVSLPSLVVRRIREALVREQDGIVWRYVMTAILKDDSSDCADIALLAANHNWPDIRVLGCDYIAYHGHHAHAVWLLPLLTDANFSVQLAAIRAAAKCRNPIVLDGQPGADSGKGLRPLLMSPQLQLRLPVAASMSCFGDPEGMRELCRLSMENHWMDRKQAVVAMGESGQSRFVEHLMRVAWTESNQHVRRAAIGSLEQLVPPANRPQGSDPARNLDRSVELWVAWWDDQKRVRTARDLGDLRTDGAPALGREANGVDGSGNP